MAPDFTTTCYTLTITAVQKYKEIDRIVEAVLVIFGIKGLEKLSSSSSSSLTAGAAAAAKIYTQLDVRLTNDKEGLIHNAHKVDNCSK